MTYQEWLEHLDKLLLEEQVLKIDYETKKLSYENASDNLKAKDKEIKDWKKVKIDDYTLPEGVTLIVGDVIEFNEKYEKWNIEKGDRFVIIFGDREFHDYTAKLFNNDILEEKEITFNIQQSKSDVYLNTSILNYIKTMKLQFTNP